jgi:hypothetical protein
MKSIFFFLLCILLFSCTSDKKEASEEESLITFDSVAIDTKIDVRFGMRPTFPKYSKQIFTDNDKEAAVLSALDALLDEYSHQEYFSIKAEDKTWHFDQQKSLRVLIEDRKNESLKEKSIHLFDKNHLIAAYRDVDMRGQDTQTNKERMVADLCPTCGVSFNLVSYDTMVNVVNEARLRELSDYYLKECNELLDWIAEAVITNQEGPHSIFERGSPYSTRYTVNSELYYKFIKLRRH